jgi:hypothetical protein
VLAERERAEREGDFNAEIRALEREQDAFRHDLEPAP